MSARGFLIAIHDDDSFDQPVIRPISPNIIISRSDFFAAREGGNLIVFIYLCIHLYELSIINNIL